MAIEESEEINESSNSNDLSNDSSGTFIVFRLGQNLYGTPIHCVREVVDSKDLISVPKVKNWYVGVCNIRGEVVNVLDLRVMFEEEPLEKINYTMLVIDTNKGLTCLLVDSLEAIENYSREDINSKIEKAQGIESQYLLGLCKSSTSKIVTLVNLIKLINNTSFTRKTA